MRALAVRERLIDHLDALGHACERVTDSSGRPGVRAQSCDGALDVDVSVTADGTLIDAHSSRPLRLRGFS